MSGTAAPPTTPAPAARPGIMPPWRVVSNFLADAQVEALVAFADAHRDAFRPTKVGRESDRAFNPAIRVSAGTRELGEFRGILTHRVLDCLHSLVADLKVSPVEASKIELELVAHGDGAFYKRHIDTQTASRKHHIRVLSGVYYFHREPKAFAGGALRLYAIGDDSHFVDIEPARNTLVVFPSWAPHEVMPVRCPSREFLD